MSEAPFKTQFFKHWTDKLLSVFKHELKDRAQILKLLSRAAEQKILDPNALSMIEGVVEMANLKVRDIMVPRPQMSVFNLSMHIDDIVKSVVKSVYSRFPIIGEQKNDIEGVLLAKDLLQYVRHEQKTPFSLKSILRPAMIVPESKRLDSLLQEFRQSHNHLAIVVNEYGGLTGLITIEDVLEEIVGEIEDEYDNESNKPIRKYKNNTYTVEASTPLEDFNDFFKASFQAEDVESIGGFITRRFGYLPKRGETLECQDHHFRILRADARRIHLLQTTPKNPLDEL